MTGGLDMTPKIADQPTGALRKRFFVYIMASRKDGVLYVGVTSGLQNRVWRHREGVVDGFTQKYFVRRLVYFEEHPNAETAIAREKQLKGWRRAWKIALIGKANPDWLDLWGEIAVP